ncbi:hypothetical protein [Streptomyces sp. NPDC020965]|uniref:hypothetical protein n=1 Tax=Streptomyces sp. NPDC020965 TaxID=3365105 RepID=UPI00379CC7FF
MGNRADESGSDVEIYRKALSTTIHADTATGAPEQLLALLDKLGLQRQTPATAGPAYVWHEAPADLAEAEQKRVATRAVPTLLMAGYVVNITDDIFDPAAYREAVAEYRSRGVAPAGTAPAPSPVAAPTPTAGGPRPGRTA